MNNTPSAGIPQHHQQQSETVHHISSFAGGGITVPPDSSRSGGGGGYTDRSAAASVAAGRGALMTPTNRIVMRVKTAETQSQPPQQQGNDGGNSNGRVTVRNAGSSWAAGSPIPTTNASASSAFLAMAAMGGVAATAVSSPAPGNSALGSGVTAAKLTFSRDDVGVPIQMFSFRMNAWDRVELLDFEPNKRLHKVRHSDGTVQWLDLTKKPTRSVDS